MAGVLKVEVAPEISGPLADGTAENALQEWVRNTAQAIADEGVDMLRAFPMNKTGRAHGGFQANLHAVELKPGIQRIKAPAITGVTWGPWLEGVSKRNESTRFKGYHLFRKTRQELQKRAPDIGQRELDKVLPKMGGE